MSRTKNLESRSRRDQQLSKPQCTTVVVEYQGTTAVEQGRLRQMPEDEEAVAQGVDEAMLSWPNESAFRPLSMFW
jgi:hypothetical protein